MTSNQAIGWPLILATAACGTPSLWPGAGGGAPVVRRACEPGPLAVEMLSMSCAPLMPLVPDSQSEKPCRATIDGQSYPVDRAGNLIAPNTFRYTYRDDGNVDRASMDDAMAIHFAYDSDARLLRTELEGIARAKEVKYDFQDGKLIRELSSGGVHNEYLYDGDRLLKIVSLVDASVTAPETATLFDYDGLGRRSAEEHIIAGRSTVRFQYEYESPDSDQVNEILELDRSGPTPRYVSKTTRSYDAQGRLLTIATDRDLDGVPDQIIQLDYCPMN